MKVKKHDARRIGIFGASGSGKTTQALELFKKVKRGIFFDVLDNGKQKNFRTLPEIQRFIVANYTKGFKIRFVPDTSRLIEELSSLCAFLQKLQIPYKEGRISSQITLFVDELDTVFPVNTGKLKNKGFYDLCLRGRHYGINIIGVSQRVSLVDLPFRANLSDVFFFRLADFNDLSTAAAILGKPYKETIRALPKYKYIYKNDSGEVFT